MHCYSHHVDEPGDGAYIWCFECGHVYRTAGDLRRAYRRQYWETSKHFGDPVWRRLWRVAAIRVKNIHFCQECIHDF